MLRDPSQTVTIPLLVDAKTPESADGGCVVFTRGGGIKFTNVRVLSPEVLKRQLWRDRSNDLASALRGVSRLRRAYMEKDMRALTIALEQVVPLIPIIPGTKLDMDWSELKMWDTARGLFVEVMSHAVKNVRWVTWSPASGEHNPAPAAYCPDMSTALAMAVFLDSVRVCPHCGRPFTPKQDNVDYCSPAHGAAYRTARSREKKRREDEKKRTAPQKKKRASGTIRSTLQRTAANDYGSF